MKLKSFPLLAMLIGVSTLAGAQCVPNQGITNPGFYPNEFATAHQNEAYQHIFQIRIMADTQIMFLGEQKTAYVDSIRINDIRNLPAGFVYECNDDNCMFIPTMTGCVVVNGNPTEGHVGEYLVDIDITVWARVEGTVPVIQDNTIEDKYLSVSPFSSSINDLSKLRPVLSPNPSVDGKFTVTGIPSNDLVGKIYDAKGVKVAEIEVQGGALDCSEFNSGLYFVKLVSDNSVVAYQKVRIR